MTLILLFALLAAPIAEIAAFIEVGGRIGVWPTLGLIVVTAIIGTALLRYQGLRTLYKVRENLDRGVLPVDEVFDGFFLVIAGALLLTPGFITDAIGLLLFAAPVRGAIKRLIQRNMAARAHTHTHTHMHMHRQTRREDGGRDTIIIDGEYTTVTPDAPENTPENTPESTNGGPRLPRG